MDNLNSLLNIIGIILAASLGWSFTSLSAWQQSRKQDNNIRREVVFYLLEFYFLITRMAMATRQLSVQLNHMVAQATQGQIPPELEKQIAQQTLLFVEPLVTDAFMGRVDKLKEGFYTTVSKLSSVEPVLAHRLSGQEEGVLSLRRVEDFWKRVENDINAESSAEWNQTKATAKELLLSLSAEEVQKQIESLIEAVARRLPKRHRRSIAVQLHKISEGTSPENELKMAQAVSDMLRPMMQPIVPPQPNPPETNS